jgi:PKD repeat protein
VYVNDGKYTIKLKVINDCDTVTYKKEINVVTSPKADFTYNIVNFCTPAIVNFQQKASNNTATFHWVFEGGTPNVSNEPNPIIKYEKVGIYAASLVVKNATGSDSVHQKAIIEVKTSPRAGFSFVQKGAELAFDNKSVGAVSYHWDFGDSTTSTEDNPKHIYTKTGKYKVALNAINDCGESSFTEIISLNFVANKELQAENSLSVFPNPTDGIFTLVLKENNDSALRFHLINSLGQVFSLENNNLNHDATYQFDLRHLPKGIYHLSVGGRNKEQWIKIVLVK